MQFNEPLFNQTLFDAEPSTLMGTLVALDGQYAEVRQLYTRIIVVGRDLPGNTVSGQYIDAAAEGAGVRLAVLFDPAIPTAALAGSVASGKAAAWRMSMRTAWLLAPQNAALNIADVITVDDALCAQNGQAYRVIGIRYEFDKRRKKYMQRLTLSAV